MIHPTASIHPSACIGAGVCIGEGVYIGAYARIGVNAHIAGGVRIVEGTRILENAFRAISFGHQDGYSRTLCWTPEGVFVTSGCWTGTIDETEAHWRAHKKDRRLSLCLIPAMRAAVELYKGE